MRRKAINRLLGAIAVTLVVSSTLLHAATEVRCREDFVDNVGSDGEILITLSGAVYRVSLADTIYSMLWLPSTALVICEHTANIQGRNVRYYEIINRDDAEKVLATRLR